MTISGEAAVAVLGSVGLGVGVRGGAAAAQGAASMALMLLPLLPMAKEGVLPPASAPPLTVLRPVCCIARSGSEVPTCPDVTTGAGSCDPGLPGKRNDTSGGAADGRHDDIVVRTLLPRDGGCRSLFEPPPPAGHCNIGATTLNTGGDTPDDGSNSLMLSQEASQFNTCRLSVGGDNDTRRFAHRLPSAPYWCYCTRLGGHCACEN